MPGNEVERYVHQGDIESRGAAELAAVGFSPAFPVQMQILNDGLLRLRAHGSFSGFRFTLNPDHDFPKVHVEAKYVSPYLVQVDASVGKRASLSVINGHGHAGSMLAMVTLGQVQKFTREYPANELITLAARPRDPERYFRGVKPQFVSDVIFDTLSDKQDLAQIGIVPANYDLSIGFKSDFRTMALQMSYVDERRTDDPVFMIHGFEARDTSETIETIVGQLGNFVAQNWSPFVE